VRKLAIAILLMSSPATAETITIIGPAPVPGASNPAPALADAPCYPIGKTDDGHYVYSMDCKNVPQAQPIDDPSGRAPVERQ
jgi:hypothetical protein